jgi:hypothetical protein
MADQYLDHESVRARVEQRLAPRMRLLRRRFWLFAHIVIFITTMLTIYSGGNHANSPLYFLADTYTIPASSFLGPTGETINIAAQTFESWQPYPLVTFLSLVWFIVLILHIVNIWAAFGRERLIQREMDREMELEKMRLQLALAGANQRNIPDTDLEKPKRVASLSDDGELIFDDESAQPRIVHRRS